MPDFATNLRRLMAEQGLTLEQVVERSGLDHRTIKGILRASALPQARTLHRLAAGLGVSSDELFQVPARLSRRDFDLATNPHVEEAVASQPALFEEWTADDFAELCSRFGTGGALTVEGALQSAERMNRNRRVHQQVALVLETAEADLLACLVQTLYQRVSLREDPVTHDSSRDAAASGEALARP